MANVVLITAIIAGAWAWRRRDFRLPLIMPHTGITPRRLVALAGWLIVGVALLFLLGDTIGGYTARNLSPAQHVHRSQEPVVFWLQILLQIGMYAGTGVCLIAFARTARRDTRDNNLSDQPARAS